MDSKTFFGKQYVQMLVTVALVCVILALGAYAYLTLKQSEGVDTGATMISVQADGKATAIPDIGTFSFSVLADGKDAAEAQSKSAESINAILAFLKGAGVADKDIKTADYNLNPKYIYDTKPCVAYSYCPPSNPTLDGYEVTQTVTVKVRSTDKAGDLISGVGEKGATNISSLQFTVDDLTVVQAAARKDAIDKAKVKADQLAKDLGVHIVKMTGFSEDQGGYYPMANRSYAMDASASGEKAVAPQVPTGENEVNSSVTITYEVK